MRKIILIIVGLILAGGIGFMGGIDYCDSQEPQLITQTQTEYVYPDENKIALLETQLDTCNQSYQHLLELNEELRQQKVREVEVIREVPIEVIREVEVVKLVEIPQQLTDWNDGAELMAFVVENSANVTVAIELGIDGKAQYGGQCSAFAIAWRDLAFQHGKNLEVESITSNEYYRWFGIKLGHNEYHIVLFALTNEGKIYYFEPQTLQIKYVGYIP